MKEPRTNHKWKYGICTNCGCKRVWMKFPVNPRFSYSRSGINYDRTRPNCVDIKTLNTKDYHRLKNDKIIRPLYVKRNYEERRCY